MSQEEFVHLNEQATVTVVPMFTNSNFAFIDHGTNLAAFAVNHQDLTVTTVVVTGPDLCYHVNDARQRFHGLLLNHHDGAHWAAKVAVSPYLTLVVAAMLAKDRAEGGDVQVRDLFPTVQNLERNWFVALRPRGHSPRAASNSMYGAVRLVRTSDGLFARVSTDSAHVVDVTLTQLPGDHALIQNDPSQRTSCKPTLLNVTPGKVYTKIQERHDVSKEDVVKLMIGQLPYAADEQCLANTFHDMIIKAFPDKLSGVREEYPYPLAVALEKKPGDTAVWHGKMVCTGAGFLYVHRSVAAYFLGLDKCAVIRTDDAVVFFGTAAVGLETVKGQLNLWCEELREAAQAKGEAKTLMPMTVQVHTPKSKKGEKKTVMTKNARGASGAPAAHGDGSG